MTSPLTGNRAPIPSTNKSPDGITVARTVSAPIPVSRWIRNGKHPNAVLESMMGEAANQAGMFRCKEAFRSAGGFGMPPSAGAGDRPRWRFATHTGPYTCYFRVVAVLAPADTGLTTDAYARVDCVTGGVTTSEQFHYGASPYNGVGSGIDTLRVVDKFITVAADSDYTVTVTDVDNSAIQSINIHEYASLTQNFNGYLPQNFAAQGPILDAYRQNLAEVTRNLWRRGGAQVWNWTTDVDSAVTILTSTTQKNLIDGVSTTNTTTSIGATVDMTGKTRLTQTTGVPCVMKAYAIGDSGVTIAVRLVNSSNAVIGTVTIPIGAAGWQSTSIVLPASADKYDIQAALTGAGVNDGGVFAVSIYEYDT